MIRKKEKINYAHDAFISHVSEDKQAIVRPLAEELRARGIKVWYDEFELRVGDSLVKSIDDGLRTSRYAVVVLSPTFFDKFWSGQELGGLFAIEAASGEKRILPVWHDLTFDEVVQKAPMLGDRLAATTENSIEDLASDLIGAMNLSDSIEPAGDLVTLRPSLGVTDRMTVELILTNVSREHAVDVHLEPREIRGEGAPVTGSRLDTIRAGDSAAVELSRLPPNGKEATSTFDLLYTNSRNTVLRRQRIRFGFGHDVVVLKEYSSFYLDSDPVESISPETLARQLKETDSLPTAWLWSQDWLLTGSTGYMRVMRYLDSVASQTEEGT